MALVGAGSCPSPPIARTPSTAPKNTRTRATSTATAPRRGGRRCSDNPAPLSSSGSARISPASAMRPGSPLRRTCDFHAQRPTIPHSPAQAMRSDSGSQGTPTMSADQRRKTLIGGQISGRCGRPSLVDNRALRQAFRFEHLVRCEGRAEVPRGAALLRRERNQHPPANTLPFAAARVAVARGGCFGPPIAEAVPGGSSGGEGATGRRCPQTAGLIPSGLPA